MIFIATIVLVTNFLPADSLLQHASKHYDNRTYDSAIIYYQKAAKAYLVKDSILKVGKVYYNMAKAYYNDYQDSLALQALDSAVYYLKKTSDKSALAAAYNLYGSYVSNLGFNKEAITFYNKSIEIAKEVNDLRVESYSLNNLGLVYKDLGDYEKALESLLSSLDLKKQRKANAKELAASKLNIGLVLDLLGKTDEALEAYNEGIVLKRKAGDSLGVAKILSNIAVILKNNDRDEEAINVIKTSNRILETVPNNDLAYVNFVNLGGLSKKHGDFNEAESFYFKALDIATAEENRKIQLH